MLFHILESAEMHRITLYYQKADDRIFVCKFSKNIKSKIYSIENSKTREQTMKI